MDPTALFNLIVNGGGTAVLLFLVIEMRKEAARDRQQIWALLEYMVRRTDPNFRLSDLDDMTPRG